MIDEWRVFYETKMYVFSEKKNKALLEGKIKMSIFRFKVFIQWYVLISKIHLTREIQS